MNDFDYPEKDWLHEPPPRLHLLSVYELNDYRCALQGELIEVDLQLLGKSLANTSGVVHWRKFLDSYPEARRKVMEFFEANVKSHLVTSQSLLHWEAGIREVLEHEARRALPRETTLDFSGFRCVFDHGAYGIPEAASKKEDNMKEDDTKEDNKPVGKSTDVDRRDFRHFSSERLTEEELRKLCSDFLYSRECSGARATLDYGTVSLVGRLYNEVMDRRGQLYEYAPKPLPPSSIDEYQDLALRTKPLDVANDSLLAMTALGLTGEAGEYADAIKKHLYHGHDLDLGAAKKELGDVLWYIAVAADLLGLKLSDVAQCNVDKLRARYPEGFSTKASKAREDTK